MEIYSSGLSAIFSVRNSPNVVLAKNKQREGLLVNSPDLTEECSDKLGREFIYRDVSQYNRWELMDFRKSFDLQSEMYASLGKEQREPMLFPCFIVAAGITNSIIAMGSRSHDLANLSVPDSVTQEFTNEAVTHCASKSANQHSVLSQGLEARRTSAVELCVPKYVEQAERQYVDDAVRHINLSASVVEAGSLMLVLLGAYALSKKIQIARTYEQKKEICDGNIELIDAELKNLPGIEMDLRQRLENRAANLG